MMKRYGCLALVLVLIFGAVAVYRASWQSPLGGPSFSQLPPQTQKQRRVEAQKLVEKVEQVARDARQKNPASRKKAFEIVASEEQLNTLLQDRLRTEKFPISNLSVGLGKEIINVQGTAQYNGIELPATISGRLQAQNGALRYEIDSLNVSGLPAPSNLRDKAQKAIEGGLQKVFANQNRARIESVEIAPGKLTLRGQTG